MLLINWTFHKINNKYKVAFIFQYKVVFFNSRTAGGQSKLYVLYIFFSVFLKPPKYMCKNGFLSLYIQY